MPVSIMLDAGHGGRDPGAVYNGRQEKDDVLKLVLAIGEILQNSGIDVEYTRTTDIYETPFQKATEANEAGVDFFISIHRNSSPLANQYMGVESLIYNLSGIKYECYTCDRDLDEDEMMRFLTDQHYQCPYYRSGDEYRVVRKQM